MEKPFRTPTITDQLIGELDRALNNIFCRQHRSRDYPADEVETHDALTAAQKKHSAGLMRVNHAGEMAAQALYQGQSLTARDPALVEKFRSASIEEADHLN